jgi:hypothetical protein
VEIGGTEVTSIKKEARINTDYTDRRKATDYTERNGFN